MLEALACGKPVITTNLGEIPNIIKNGEHAILVNPNENEIAQNILELLANPDLTKFLGRNAALLVQQKYSIESIVDQTVNVYTEPVYRKAHYIAAVRVKNEL